MNSESRPLSAEGLSAGYGKTVVVSGISFELRAGEILTLIGKNGAGKSTLLRTCAAQLPAAEGTVYLDGRDIAAMSGSETAKRLAVLLTERLIAERMTCGDVVATGRYPYTGRLGILSDEDTAQVKEAMELTGTAELYGRDFRQISDGQRQCVMIARAIAQQPKVMLLDEPTSFLDIGNKLKLLTLLRRLVRERGIAVMMSLHELELAQRFSDRVMCIGDEIFGGTPEEVFTDGRIEQLYGVTEGGYNALYGTAEPPKTEGAPEVFVICGGGSGIPVFRQLWRQGIPFAAGIIQENDIDFPAAKALAAEVVTEKAFEPISGETFSQAEKVMERCGRVICTLDSFGQLNRENERLRDMAEESGKLVND